MDRHVNKPFKDSMRESWMAWMKLERATTKMGNLKQLTRQDVINWVSKAWASIKVEIITWAATLSEDDCVNSDIPPLELDDTTDEQVHDSDADADDMGNPFSEDETDSENWITANILVYLTLRWFSLHALITLRILLWLVGCYGGWAYFQEKCQNSRKYAHPSLWGAT